MAEAIAVHSVAEAVTVHSIAEAVHLPAHSVVAHPVHSEVAVLTAMAEARAVAAASVAEDNMEYKKIKEASFGVGQA